MSVVSKKTTSSLSILKKNFNRTSSSKVHFKVPLDVKRIFLDLKNGISTKEYYELVCTIRDCEISDDELVRILTEAKNCISLLDYNLRLFVQALLILRWSSMSNVIVTNYQDFINNLVSAHPQQAKVIIDQLVKSFLNSDGSEWVDDMPPANVAESCANIHQVLKSTVKIVPLAEDIVISALKSNFPYFKLTFDKQQSYIYNCLKVIDYLPNSRREILLILVEKLIIIDANSPREEIMDINSGLVPADEVGSNSNVDSLDYGMLALFRYIDGVCRPSGVVMLGTEARALFDDLLEVFDKALLTTYGCCHVQFVVFYMCSLSSNSAHTLAKKMLASLWKKVLDPAIAPLVRRSAASYIGSFLARAAYLPTGFLKKHLQEMSEWILKYIEQSQSQNCHRDIHGVFYAVCQSLFYVIAFRHKDLVDSTRKLKFLQSLNLSKMVNCSLNPLRACSRGVVDHFAEITRDYELTYCYSIIENNNWTYLASPTIDEFFPFDPYILRRSSPFINPLYREWKCANDDDNEDVAMETDAVTGRKAEEEDDFIACTPLQISDVKLATSPGFKMSI